MTRKQLIFIPGLGDRVGLYRFIRPLWRFFGFDVHIFVFGWNDQHTIVERRLASLGSSIDALPAADVYIIGVSAGGTAAVNMLALKPRAITKVVTVCTPYMNVTRHENMPLLQSMRALDHSLASMPGDVKAKILSLHGLRDHIVPAGNSRPAGVRARRVWAAGHALSIVLALTLYSRIIRRFFKTTT